MKRLLLVFATFLSFNVFAQWDIEEADFVSAGDSLIYAVDSSFTDQANLLQVIGDSLDWDFLSLAEGLRDTVLYQAPGTLPNGNAYSGTDFGYWDGPMLTFIKKSTNAIKIAGMAVPLSSFIDSSLLDSTMQANIPDDILFKYDNGGLPYLGLEAVWGSYETGSNEGSFTFFYGDSIMGFYADSIRIREIVNYTSEVDGFGTIHIPDGDFYSIRQYIRYSRSFAIDIGVEIPWVGMIWFDDIVPIPFNITQNSYRWFVENAGFPVVEINTDSAHTFMVSRFQVQPPASQVGVNESSYSSDWHMFTSGNQLLLESQSGIENVSIVDVAGRTVYNNSGIKNSMVAIPFNKKGIFFVTVQTGSGVPSTRKFIR